jgi:hypothetical protein
MTSIKMAAATLAAVVLAGCATPPMPPIATHTFVILTKADDSALNDKASLAAPSHCQRAVAASRRGWH